GERGEDTLLRIAWLLEEDQRFDEAYALWKDMWQTTSVPARQRQSQDRMLDLAARTGKLADLAIELEERIAEGKADDRTLSLLVHIYTRANDPVSAAEILQDFARRSGNRVEALKRLARVYLDCEQFGRCNAILRQLAAIDPANRVDYWQQIAMMALERRQPQQAKAALATLSVLAAGDEMVDEFCAGVLDMTGLHEEAAAAYGRALARHPDRIEVLLLWGRAMRDAGRADRAVARFQNLIEDAAEDDLFTVAVDGLLNLSARPAAMRSALRRVYARIAAKPDKVFLYQLGADLLESLGRAEPMRDLMEQAVVVAGERRGPLLRELMDGAKADGLNDRVIQYGQSLLGLGEEQPPQVFLDLGEAMFKEHDLALAERVFERAAAESDYSAIRQRVATYYEEANMPAVADRIIRELLGTEPDNVPLLIRSGALCEQLGEFARAFDQYDRAADLMLRRLAGSVRADESGRVRGRERPSRRTDRAGRAMNLDEMARFFRSAANGLRSAARTPALRDRLLTTLSARIEQELKALAADKSLMPTIEGNPRLDNLAWFLREVAFSFHVPDAADRIDRRLLDLYPKDAGLRTTVVRERIDWGLYARAAAMAADAPPDWSPPTAITIDTLLSDKAALENAVAKGTITLSLASQLIPGLLMTGRDEDARRVLRATPASYAPNTEADLSAAAPSVAYARGEERSSLVFVEAASTMAALSIGLEEHETLRAWTNAWIDACSKMRTGSAIVTSLKRCMSVVWNALTPEERTAFADRLGRLADAAEGEKRLHLNLLRLQLADRLAIPFDGLDRILQEAPQDKTLDADDLAELLQRAPADARPDLLKRIGDAREPARKRAVLFGIAANLKVPADEALMQSFETLLKAAPRQRRDLDEDSSFAGGWVRSRTQPELARRLAEVLLSESPNDPAVMVAAAAARDSVGLHDEAMPLAKEAIEALLDVKKPTSEHARLVAEAARIMRPDEIRATIADLDERQQIEGPSAMRFLVKAVLFDATGDKAEAIAAYRSAFEMQPGERVFVSKLISALKQSGRSVELSRLLARHLRKSTIMETYEWYTLVTLYGELFDPLKAMQAAQRLETVQGPVEVMRIARSMGRTEGILPAFRRLYTRNRDSGRFYSPAWPAPPSPGGMIGYFAKQQGRGWGRAFSALADLPFAQEEFTALLLAAPPQQGDVLALIEGLLRATRLNNTRAALIDSLADAWQRRALTDKDRRMIVALAREDPANITDALMPALDDIVLHTPPGDAPTLSTLAATYRARGNPDPARRILRWLVISDMRSGRAGGSDRFGRMEDYLALLPDNERAAARRKLLAALEPTPLDEPTDAFDSEWLTCWAAAGEPAELNRRIEMIRKRIESAEAEATPRLLAATLARFDAEAGRFEA
ncbi:MAG TPA: tetratricopeptide repeat protein, partial [Phycisphaerae bacterium]|nr:tetratricopeptide repeat protein [Phycisphaerae bacterium]